VNQPSRTAPRRPWALIMGLYLLGIFIGAIDTGIVTPGRTVIQRDLGVTDQAGIWMITIYTLAYAAAIPVMGKLADRVGRKQVYLVSILLFGLGSLACGLSQDLGSFPMLIIARAVQAVGGGGILPIATAEIGTEVPIEKRGMALGLVGGVYGVANIFGASAGSLILDVAGVHNWQWIFYINVPIAAVIVIAGLFVLRNHREQSVKPIDVLGSLLLVGMILSLLYGIRNLDLFDFGNSIRSTDVWPFLVAFAALLPVFLLAERRAADPVLNLRYFTDFSHGGVLLLALLSGVTLMAVVFVPQFAENALRIPTGAGGYTVIALGVASGVGAPLSGTLTDRFGAKAVLGLGAGLSVAAAAVGILWAIPQPGLASVFTTLGLFGLGLGFVVGSPLNYMMLARTRRSESNSALATLSLTRALGTTLAPAIMVGFLAQAGTLVQDRLTAVLPTSVPAPALPYATELQATFAELKADENLKDKVSGVDFPDLSSQSTIEIDPNGGGTLPDDLVDLLKTADVTNIVERSQTVATRMFDEQTPARVAEIQDGVRKGIDSLADAATELDSAAAEMADGLAEMDTNLADMADGLAEMGSQLDEMSTGIAGMTDALAELDGQLAELSEGIAGMDSALAGMNEAIPGLTDGVAGMDEAIGGLTEGLAGMDEGLAQQQAALEAVQAQLAELPPDSPAAPELQGQVAGLQAAIQALQAERAEAAAQLDQLTPQRAEAATKLAALQEQKATLTAQRQELVAARTGAQGGRDELAAQREQLQTGRNELAKARADLATGREELTKARADLASGREEVVAAKADLAETTRQLTVLKDAVPGAFEAALVTYLKEIDARAPELRDTFGATVGDGFRGVFGVYGGASAAMLLLLPLIPAARRSEDEEGPAAPAASGTGESPEP